MDEMVNQFSKEIILDNISELSINLLNAIQFPLYIIDANNYSILFSNKKTQEYKKRACYSLEMFNHRSSNNKPTLRPIDIVKKTKKTFVFEEDIIHGINDSNIMEVHIDPILNKENEVKYVIEYYFNITNHKRTAQIQSFILELDNIINETKDLGSFLEFFHTHLKKFVHVEDLYIALNDTKRNLISYPYIYEGNRKIVNSCPLGIIKEIVEYIQSTKKPILVDGNNSINIDKFQNISHPRIIMGIPLFLSNEITGVFIIKNENTYKNYNLVEEFEQTKIICNFLAQAIERKKVELALKSSEEKFKIISEAANDAIVIIDDSDRVKFWNMAAEEIFGYKFKEIYNKKLHDIIVLENYKEYSQKGLKDFHKTGQGKKLGLTSKFEAVKKDGSIVPVEVSVSSIKMDGKYHAVGLIRDISERVKKEKAFSKVVSQYLAMINTVPAMIYLKDMNHKYIIANEVFCDFVGKKLEEIKGKTDYDIFPVDKADLNLEMDKMVIDKNRQVIKHEERVVDKDKVERWMSTTKVPIHDNQGLVSGLVGLIQDVTELHISQEKLMQSDKLAAIGTLAAGVAHEINNPIGFVNSNLNTMGKYIKVFGDYVTGKGTQGLEDIKDILEDFKDAIDESSEGIQRVKKIVADLKSFSRVDHAEKESVNINEGLESTLNIVWNELKYKCKVEKDYGELPEYYCYPNQINQVFMNILINAGHAIEHDKGLITIKTWNDGNKIYISIKDNGRGIPQKDLNKIFQPFFTTKEVGKGTGLGLSLVYDIIKKHKGNIDVKSKEGTGTEFIITIPLEGLEHGK
ncbi:MAG: PAS domain S-box protein [FCB group bacterium]|nr:PAS domain S-box protein [FCB group bacterium]